MRNMLAHRYAKALMDVAMEQDSRVFVDGDINQLIALFAESPDLVETLDRCSRLPEAANQACAHLVDSVKLSDLTARLLAMLTARKRLGILPEVASAYLTELRIRMDIVTAAVTSIRPLDDTEKHDIQECLNKVTGKKVDIKWLNDSSILGGLHIKMGDRVFDGSLKTRMNQLQEHLIYG